MNTITLNLTAPADSSILPILITGQSPVIDVNGGRGSLTSRFGNYYEVYSKITLYKATIRAYERGNVYFELRQGFGTTGTLIKTVVVPVIAGVQEVTLNLEMDPSIWGNNFTILKQAGEPTLFRTNTSVTYPLSITDPIHGTLGSVVGSTAGNGFYYWFYSPKFTFIPTNLIIEAPPITIKGATTLNLSLTGIPEQDYRVDLLTINWGDGSSTETYKRDIFRNYRTSSIFNEVLYGKLGGSILGVYNHDYINQTSSYNTPYTLNIVIQKNNGRYINIQQPISSFWGSYYDDINDLSILDAQVLPLTGNNSFLSLESGTGSVFAVNLQ